MPKTRRQLDRHVRDVRSGRSDEHAAQLRGSVQGSAAVDRDAALPRDRTRSRSASPTPTSGRIKQPDGTLKLYFAVENPSGVSAKALAAILDKTLSGLPASEIATVNCDIVEKIFRQNISMGKGMGLMSMVNAVQALARRASQT